MEGQKDNQDPPPRPLARHLSDADRLRKVIQELMDTEKSYVKVKKTHKTNQNNLASYSLGFETDWFVDGLNIFHAYLYITSPLQGP